MLRGMWGIILILGFIVYGTGPIRAADTTDEILDRLGSELPKVVMPAGIKVRITHQGPVFTDKSGMTLYTLRQGDANAVECPNSWPVADDLLPILKYYADYPAPPCAQQWPPIIASKDEKEVGEWKKVRRSDGRDQWSYRGKIVHTSYLDFLPGDVNGSFKLDTVLRSDADAVAAKVSLPPGMSLIRRRGVGLVASANKHALYMFPNVVANMPGKVLPCDSCGLWTPAPAASMSNNFGDWKSRPYSDGSKVWTLDDRILFTYKYDQEETDIKGYGVNGAQPVVLYPEELPPRESGVGVRLMQPGLAYTSAQGMTLYSFSCSINAPGVPDPGAAGSNRLRVNCDGWNDDVSLREQYCPSSERCAEIFRPLQAPANIKPRGGAWSVAVIPDPRYPLRWKPAAPESSLEPGAIKVWTFGGQPLYTSARDQVPGTFNGAMRSTGGTRFVTVIASQPL
jgi:predicted lipoprotein with Yx(FWY)xxD motif